MSLKSKSLTISDEFIREVCQRLEEGHRVRRNLPGGGRLHIDRRVPFLSVYRKPKGIKEDGTEKLLMGETAYLIWTSESKFQERLRLLIREIATTLSSVFGSFLLLEIWASPETENMKLAATNDPTPFFKIHSPGKAGLSTTVQSLQSALQGIKVSRQRAKVEIISGPGPCPRGLVPLISPDDAQKIDIYQLGLEVKPIYRNGGSSFPVLLRRIQRGVDRSLNQAFFEFLRSRTTYKPEHYQALGRRSMVKAVWEADRKLAEVSNTFDFLLLATPTNPDAAWRGFKRSGFKQTPEFDYRPLPIDPALLKRALFAVPIDRLEDPVITQLFRDQQVDLDRKITMLSDRGTNRFLYGSLQLYGGVSDSLMKTAEDILERTPAHSRENQGGSNLNAKAFAKRAIAEIAYYRRLRPEFTGEVEIRNDIYSGLMVSRGKLLIGRETSVPPSRANPLIQHEIGTHLLTYNNGKAQPFRQLYLGLAGYDDLQEGLAVLAEYLVDGLSRPRMRLLAARVIAARMMSEGASFAETFRYLNRMHDFSQSTAFTLTMRIYRGGGLTKDAVYLRGLVRLLQYLKNEGELEPLLVGKISSSHIPIIRELQYRGILNAVPLRPRYLDDPKSATKLKELRESPSSLDLMIRRKKS